MNVLIDVGNTRVKYAFFEDSCFLGAKYCIDDIFDDIGKWKEQGKPIDIFLSGSAKLDEGVRILLRGLCDSWLEAGPLMPLPVKIGYATPDTLGFDRIAICAGAMALMPGRPLLVIDSGTAVTFNYVSENGVFLGGNISPGLDMRFKGLHLFTARLPFVDPADNYGGMGRTTEEAVRNGVMDGMLFEVSCYINLFFEQQQRGGVVISGGNARFLQGRVDNRVLFCDTLGFVGLNEIFTYSKKIK